MLEFAVLGVDLGKNSCSVVGLDATGRVVLRRRLHRDGVTKLAAGSPGCVVAMEACCGAHHLGRRLREAGHEVRLMSLEYVRPYVKAQKNDERDAEAIAEAVTRPTMRFPVEDQRAEWRELDRRIEAFDEEFAAEARSDEAARLLTMIPGFPYRSNAGSPWMRRSSTQMVARQTVAKHSASNSSSSSRFCERDCRSSCWNSSKAPRPASPATAVTSAPPTPTGALPS